MCVLNFHIVDTDAAYYDGIQPQKILSHCERRKKVKYSEACLERRCHSTTLMVSVDGVMGEETKTAAKQLAAALSTK